MHRISYPFHTVCLALAAATVLTACGSDSPTVPDSITGIYSATTFTVVPDGQSAIDVLAQGGSLTLVIRSDNTTGGSLSLPASATGGAALTATMEGAAILSGNTVQFLQSADTFVRDLTWTVVGNTLQVSNQTAGSAQFTITLTRQ